MVRASARGNIQRHWGVVGDLNGSIAVIMAYSKRQLQSQVGA
jgi:hypothetical protein